MGKRVSLFVTCIVDQLFPKVGMAMAEVLERAGLPGGFPGRPDLLRPAGFQHRISRRGAHGGAALPEDVRDPRVHRGAVRLLHGHDRRTISRSCSTRSRRRWRAVHALEQRVWEFSTFLHEVARGGRRGRAPGGRGHLSRRLPRAARAGHQGRRRAGCWPTCAAWNCGRWSRPRNAAASAARSR